MMTRAYPEEQYLRVWVCVAIILILTGTSMAVWRAGSAMPVPGLGHKLLATGALLVLLTFLAPFSTGATVQWLVAALVVVAAGEALRRTGGRGETERTVSTLTLQVVALAGVVASLWVIPFGHHSYIPTRIPQVMEEPGTVALSTKLPWTIMLVVVVAAYFGGVLLRDRLAANSLRVTLVVLWLLAPPVLVYLILRDPDFDMGHVIGTDIPIFLAYAVLGSALLLWLTRPSTGEIGRIVAAMVLVAGFATFLSPMRMVLRLDMLLLAAFALAAPTFAGGSRSRNRYTGAWLLALGVMSWLITSVNTASTVKVPGGFFIGGIAITFMVAIFTIVLSVPLGIALALAREAPLILLDEPVTGLDLASQERILQIVAEERNVGRTVILSTHHLDEARHCDRVILLAGRVVAQGTPDEVLCPECLREAYGDRVLGIHRDHDHPHDLILVDDHGHGGH